MTNATRYGERTADGAVSFLCAACGELAAVVRATPAEAPADMGPPIGITASDHDGVIIDHFIGTAWVATSRAALEAVQSLIDDGSVDPRALRDINWELAPFYCPDCQLNYCRNDWDTTSSSTSRFTTTPWAPARRATSTWSTTETWQPLEHTTATGS